MGQVLLPICGRELDDVLDTPSRVGHHPSRGPLAPSSTRSSPRSANAGWALSDELLSVGIRSVAAPVRDRSGRVVAAMNVTVHAAETSIERLVGDYLPLLLEAAAEVDDGVVETGDAAPTLLSEPATAGPKPRRARRSL